MTSLLQSSRPSSSKVPSASIPSSAAVPITRPARTAAESIVEQLCSMGISTFFGVPGGPVIPVFDAILTNKTAELVESRHETTAVFAAMGLYRASGRVSSIVVTAGPGATNVVTGVVAAHCERTPVVVICGDVPWATTGKKLLQDTGAYGIGIERMLSGVTRAVIRIAHASSAAAQIRAAAEAALNPANPGPVLVVISVDRAGSSGTGPAVYGQAPQIHASRAVPERELLESVARHLESAQRPLVLVGAGCRGEEEKVAKLIDAIGAPFVTTPQAKGLISETHLLSLRTCGMGASWWARRYMKSGADVTLVLGSDLDDVSTAGTPPIGADGRLIHVDVDSTVFARNFRTEIGAAYTVGSFADALTALLTKRRPATRSRLIAEAKAESPFDVPTFAHDDSGPVAPHRVIADLEKAVGPEATFVTDIGEHMLFALHYITAKTPQRFAIHLGLGSMGSGIGSAIGLALGNSARRVVCICGDGGMQMAGSELLVAIKHRLPIVYAIYNDARYNMVYHGYRHTFGREAAWNTECIDFAAWAEAMGARGRRIDKAGEITAELLDELMAYGGPVVLDIRQNADLRIRGDGRIEAVRQMSMIHE
jgi:acetolactate synthase I/II/III large subunit